MRRRMMFSGAAATALAAMTGGAPAAAEELPAMAEPTGPPAAGPGDAVFPDVPHPLRPGSAAEAGLVAEHVERIVPAVSAHMEGSAPSFPGFVVLASRNGVIAEHRAVGHRLRYESWDEESGTAVELPEDRWEPMSEDTIFDLASVSKLFTATVAGRLHELGRIDFEATVVDHLPEFGALDPAKSTITMGQLLSHTSGQIAWVDLYEEPDDEARMRRIFAEPLLREPGSGYGYSDLNLIVLAEAMERVTGSGLDDLVAEYITGPLGMADTGYNPPPEHRGRIAATEYQPWTGRGMIRGSVHDENAWSFGGVAGHAGVFATAADLAVFGQMILNGGAYGEARVLGEETARLVFTDANPRLGAGAARGLGWQLHQRWYMDAMTSPITAGHTGYTGTSLVLDPLSGSMAVLLTNRVHPTRNRGTVSSYRRAAHRPVARAVPVKPRTGRQSWYSGQADGTEATLTAALDSPVERGTAQFAVWYDTEPTDLGSVRASADGEEWETVAVEFGTGAHRWSSAGAFSGFSGRRWIDAEADLPAGTRYVRWSYVSDSYYQGRGVYVDKIKIREGRRVVFESSRPRDRSRLEPDGWTLSGD
ncbi:serine hydrolase domain-containing protein [Glycomyces xiaoerkulensis]|uniref:serine hydrolase domain-containing protein n=1 Tax=Glycomyces xiaoerkulensis TaxID=2038139 RepID=UPI000C263FE5|nr:serine hydrolase domain-containing protein [Glycomyces xiaoerkulensis]